MDTFSHGVWSYFIFHRSPRALLAILFGVLPDLLSWTVYLFYQLLKSGLPAGPPVISEVPAWTWTLYGLTHSVIITASWLGLIFVLTKIFNRKFPLFVLTYPLAILIDIPLHSRDFLPTPFLWPLSEWHFPGFSWGNRWFMLVNLGLILVIVVWIFVRKRLAKKSSSI
jgi:hypothetical protein